MEGRRKGGREAERKENWVKVRRQRYSELSWLVYLLDKLVCSPFRCSPPIK